MKKYLLLILLLIPINVFAASAYKVTSLSATVAGNTISFKGTTEDSVYAVMCKLLDKNDKEINLKSFSVDANAFKGSFEVEEKGTYKITCARFEGGEFTTTEAEVKEDEKEETKEETNTKVDESKLKNPKTGDNLKTSIAISTISTISLVTSIIYIKKKKLV